MKWSKSKNRPHSKSCAPTIWCKWEDAGKCCNALAKIYSRNNNGAYPLANQARFIPNTVDSRFITSVSARAMVIKAQTQSLLSIEGYRNWPQYCRTQLFFGWISSHPSRSHHVDMFRQEPDSNLHRHWRDELFAQSSLCLLRTSIVKTLPMKL